MTVDRVIAALRGLRLHTVAREDVLYGVVELALVGEGLVFRPQVRLGPGARIDYVVEGDLGVEVKAGPVAFAPMVRQLERYAASGIIESLLLVTERGLPGLPERLLGKPVHQVALQQLWGIAS